MAVKIVMTEESLEEALIKLVKDSDTDQLAWLAVQCFDVVTEAWPSDDKFELTLEESTPESETIKLAKDFLGSFEIKG